MKTKKTTSRESGISPAALSALANGDMENFLVASTPGGIEAQEKRGQLRQAEKETLPIEGTSKPEERKQLEALGFRFTGVDDGLFTHVDFPAGWAKRPTEHSMWSELLDAKGRKRGMIFYKAAFYDQRAHVHLAARLRVGRDYDAKPTRVFIEDQCGIVEKEIAGLAVPDWEGVRAEAEKHQSAIDDATAKLTAWLKVEYPKHENPLAYWES